MADSSTKNQFTKLLERAIVACIFMFAVAAPNSIAAAQTAWLAGMALWLIRFALKPRPVLFRTPIDYWLLGFFILTGLTAFVSYEPLVSIGKLRAASLFTIVYLVAENIRSLRIVRLLALMLIASCMVSVFYSIGERAVGRGVKVYGLSQTSPLYVAGIRDGDTLLSVDDIAVNEPEDLVNAISKPDSQPVRITIFRYEWQPTFSLKRGELLPGNTAIDQLGFSKWTRGRDWRASGFFGHYVTYAEVLQLVLALTLGLFISLQTKKSLSGALLFAAVVGLAAALALTVTRAVWLGCLISSAIILLLTLRRRTVVVLGLLAIPLIVAGLVVLQQKRNVRFFDSNDGSTTWRQIVWAEGAALLVSKPRHLLVGVGMDSIKAHWREWGLFAGGKLPRGHMHSNFLQIALERGVPILILWLGFLFVYARTLWRGLRNRQKLNWMDRGILLGALGGLSGFFVSGIVHYNWGDSEVVMVLYFLMGLSIAINHQLNHSTLPRQVNS